MADKKKKKSYNLSTGSGALRAWQEGYLDLSGKATEDVDNHVSSGGSISSYTPSENAQKIVYEHQAPKYEISTSQNEDRLRMIAEQKAAMADTFESRQARRKYRGDISTFENKRSEKETALNQIRSDRSKIYSLFDQGELDTEENRQNRKDITKRYGIDTTSYKDLYKLYKDLADTEKNARSEFSAADADLIGKKQYDFSTGRVNDLNRAEKEVKRSSDFAKYSKQGANVENVDVAWTGKGIENKAKYYRDNDRMSEMTSQGIESRNPYEYMTDDEYSIYNYYLAKEGQDKAEEYFNSIADRLNARMAQSTYENIEDNTAMELAFGVAAGYDQWKSGKQGLAKFLSGDTSYTPTSAEAYTSSLIKNDLQDNKVAGIAYDLISTTTNMVPSIMLSVVTGGLAGEAEAAGMIGAKAVKAVTEAGKLAGSIDMGSGAAGNAYTQMINAGYDKKQARTYGTIIGVAETTLQEVIGGIGSLGGKLTGASLKAMAEGINNAAIKFALDAGGSMFAEGNEEFLQDILEPFIKSFATGEMVHLPENYIADALYSGMLGALSAGPMEVIPSSVNTIAESSLAKSRYGDNVQDLIGQGMESAEGTRSRELAEYAQSRLDKNKKVSGITMQDMVNANEQAMVEEDTAALREAVVQRLQEQGETGNVEVLADAIVKTTTGTRLTRSEQKAVEQSEVAPEVISDVNPQNIATGRSGQWTSNLSPQRVNADAHQFAEQTVDDKNEQIANKYHIGQSYLPGITRTETLNRTIERNSKLASKPTTASDKALNINRAAVNDSVSDTGSTVVKSTGEKVDITRLESVDSASPRLVLSDGSTVSKSDIEYDSEGTAVLIEYLTSNDFDTDTANQILALAKDRDGDMNRFLLGVDSGIKYGTIGIEPKYIDSKSFFKGLRSSEQSYVYNIGRSIAEKTTQQKSEQRQAQKTNQKVNKGRVDMTGVAGLSERQKADLSVIGYVTSAITHGTVHFYESVAEIPEGVQGAPVAISKSRRVLADDSILKQTKKGKGDVAPNGFYVQGTGDIYLDINAGNNGEGVMLWTFAHELVHFIKDWNPTGYKNLADFLVAEYGENGVFVDELVAKKMAELGIDDYEYALEEVVADSMTAMLTDTDALVKLRKLHNKDASLYNKIRSFIRDMLTRVQNAYKELKGKNMTSEQRLLSEMEGTLQRMSDLFAEALVEAGETFEATEIAQKFGNDLGTINTNENGDITAIENKDGSVIACSERTWTNGGRDILEKTLLENGFGREEVRQTIASIDSTIKFLQKLAVDNYRLNDALNAEVTLDLKNGRAVLHTLTPNGDYPINFDLSTICKKRIAYQNVLNRLLESGKFNKIRFNGAAIAEVNRILRENGFETACPACFVEARRMQIQNWAETFVTEWNDEVDKRKENAENFGFAEEGREFTSDELMQLEQELRTGKKNNKGNLNLGRGNVKTKMGRLMDRVPSLQKHLTVNDILLPDGMTKIRQFDSNMFSLIKQRYGANSPKITQQFEAYNSDAELLTFKYAKDITGESVKGGQNYIKEAKKILGTKKQTTEVTNLAVRNYLRDIGGARSQSFSDFIIENVLDKLQLFAGVAARRFSMHEYTKEISSARIFGMTGVKENISIIHHIDPALGSDYAGLTRNADGTYSYVADDYENYIKTGKKSQVQSAGFKDAVALMLDPRYSAHVGTIAIGFSDNHISMMLNDDLIRMVIPYHKSGLPPIFAELTNVGYATDYTKLQNTTVLQYFDMDGMTVEGSTLGAEDDIKVDTGYLYNKVLQETGDPRKAAQQYLDWCAEKHPVYKGKEIVGYATFKPKFSGGTIAGKTYTDFTAHENYYKLLEDFNTYDCITGEAARQGDVTMNYPSKENALNAEQLEEYKARLRDTGLFTEKEIEKYAGVTQMSMEELITKELNSRKVFNEEQDAKFESTMETIMQTLESDYARTEEEVEEWGRYIPKEERDRLTKARSKSGKSGVKMSSRTETGVNDVQYSERGNGYDGMSMSVNARNAYANGERPMSRWNKADIISAVSEINPDVSTYLSKVNLSTLKKNLLANSSWHHTSMMYNKTDFYSVDEEAARKLTVDTVKNWATHKETKALGKEYRGDFEYIEWTGSKNHPKANSRSLKDVNIEERGSFYIVKDDSGNEIIRKKIGSNGTRAINYEEEARRQEESERIQAATEDRIKNNSSAKAYEMYKRLSGTGEISSSGSIYERGRKPSRMDYLFGLDQFFKVGEQRLAENENRGYSIETWNGTEWVPEESNNSDVRYSTRNSLGEELTPEQQEYFRDSKVRDEDGRLAVTYHGSPAENITAFDRSMAGKHTGAYSDDAIWFTDSKEFADGMSYEELAGSSMFTRRRGKKGRVYETYLNMTNPLDMTNPTRAMLDTLYGFDEQSHIAKLLKLGNHQLLKQYLDYDALREQGYDGVIAYTDTKQTATEYGVFSPEQIKDVTNKTPTSSEDIRYSERDSAGNQLSKEQQSYFKLSEIRDEDGNLMVVHHSTDSSFSVFDPNRRGKITDGNATDITWASTAHVGFWFNTSDIRDRTFQEKELTGYLNVESPYRVGSVEELSNAIIDNYGEDFGSLEDSYYDGDYGIPRKLGDSFVSFLKDEGYDGIIVETDEEFGGSSYVAFDSNQFKNIDNQNPTSSPDIRYQDRQAESTDSRTLLSNALETVAQNDTERQYIQKYQAKIAEINADQNTLAEVRQELQQIRFATGQKMTDRITELTNRANTLADKIARADKQLLKLEAAKPLKDVLKREKAVAIRKEREAGREALSALRERTETRMSKNKYIPRIEKLTKELTDWAVHPDPKKGKFMLESFKGPVLNFLKALDFQTYTADGTAREGKANTFRVEQQQAIAAFAEKFSDYSIESDYGHLDLAPDMLEWVQKMSENYTRALSTNSEWSVRTMSTDELYTLYKLLKSLKTSIRNADSFYMMNSTIGVNDLARGTIDHLAPLAGHAERKMFKGADSILRWDYAQPVTVFDRFGESGQKIYKGLIKGQNVEARNIQKILDFTDEAYTKEEVKQWREEIVPVTVKKVDIDENHNVTEREEAYNVTKAQLMELYLLMNDPDARRHIIEGGGIRFDNVEIKGKTTRYTNTMVSEEDVTKMLANLSEREREVANKMQQFLSGTGAEWGNAISMRRFGYKAFGDNQNYYPIKTIKGGTSAEYEAKTRTANIFALLNKSFTKERNVNANNAIIVGDLFKTFTNHMSEMAIYNAWALPVIDMIKWFNFKVPQDVEAGIDETSVRDAMRMAYGDNAYNYVRRLLESINSQSSGGLSESVAFKNLRMVNRTAVAANIRVAVQQPFSITRAMELLPAKYMKPLVGQAHKAAYDEMIEHSGFGAWKDMGYYDVDVSRPLEAKVLKNESFADRVTEKGMFLAEKGDQFTWATLWNACKTETKAKNPGISEEDLIEKTTDRFDDLIARTQVVDSVLTKSQWMRSDSFWHRMTSSFMSEPMTSYNTLLRQFDKFQRDLISKGRAFAVKNNKKAIATTVGVFLLTQVVNGLATAPIDAMRDESDDEYWKKLLAKFKKNVQQNLIPTSMMPYISDIADYIIYGSEDRPDMALYTKVIDLGKSVSKTISNYSPEKLNYTMKSALDTASSLTGIPMGNVTRDVLSIYNQVVGGTGHSDLKFRTKSQNTANSELTGDSAKVFRILTGGDADRIARLKGMYDTEDKWKNARRKALREQDPRITEAAQKKLDGDFAGYKNLVLEIKGENVFSQDDIIASINTKINELDTGVTETSAPKAKGLFTSSDLQASVDEGNFAEIDMIRQDLYDTKILNGTDEDAALKQVNESTRVAVKDSYYADAISTSHAVEMLVTYNGLDPDAAEQTVRYWEFKKANPELDITDTAIDNYYDIVQPSGISLKDYADYINRTKDLEGDDLNGDGEVDSGTKKVKVLVEIDALPITSEQKDALYAMNGWSMRRLYEAPWHR